ncbi:MAG TPA: cobalamin biosynthesis protein CobG [Novosphingobium sp.]
MSGFVVKGWCPDAWRPMVAGDGLLVRVKPRLARLTREQMLGLADAAITCGNGLIDMTRRANLQLRGVADDMWPALLERLKALDLVDADASIEGRRNILVPPTWRQGDDTHRIATELHARLGELPELPGKIGFVVDAGVAPLLSREAGDFRIERSRQGSLALRADGHPAGVAVALGREVDALIALAEWFVESGGGEAGRMARHMTALPAWAVGDLEPTDAAASIALGGQGAGTVYGLPFGRMEAAVLARLAARLPEGMGMRTTPWRLLLLEVPIEMESGGLLVDPTDPLLRVDACPGMPACPQATVETRDLARRLALQVDGRLHVSGCSKSCASAAAATVTLTGHDGLYDLALNARAGSPPLHSGLDRAGVLAHLGAA